MAFLFPSCWGGGDFMPLPKKGWSKRITCRDIGGNHTRRLASHAHAGHEMDLVYLLCLVEQEERKLDRDGRVAREYYHRAACTPMIWSFL